MTEHELPKEFPDASRGMENAGRTHYTAVLLGGRAIEVWADTIMIDPTGGLAFVTKGTINFGIAAGLWTCFWRSHVKGGDAFGFGELDADSWGGKEPKVRIEL